MNHPFKDIELLPNGQVKTRCNIVVHGQFIPVGQEFDGATIPRLFWTLLGYYPLHHKVLFAAILHDYLIRIGKRGPETDDRFRAALIIDGVPKWKAKAMGWGVRKWRQLGYV